MSVEPIESAEDSTREETAEVDVAVTAAAPGTGGGTAAATLAYFASGGPFGPLGQFGPLGAFGPLGPYGPVRHVRPVVKAGYGLSKEAIEGEFGVLGPRGILGPLGPLGPLGALGPLGLGPFEDSEVAFVHEDDLVYRSYLEGSSYVIGSAAASEGGEVYDEGDDFEDVYQIALRNDDTLTVVLTQTDPALAFDVILVDEERAEVARSTDLPGQVKYLQADLPAGVYEVGISIVDGTPLAASGKSEYALSVLVY